MTGPATSAFPRHHSWCIGQIFLLLRVKESPAPRYVHFTDAFCLVLCDGIVVTLYGYCLMWVLPLFHLLALIFLIVLTLPFLLSRSYSLPLTLPLYSRSPAFAPFPLLSLCREKGLGGSLGQRTFQAETYRPPLLG